MHHHLITDPVPCTAESQYVNRAPRAPLPADIDASLDFVAEPRWIDLLDPSQEELEKAMPRGLHERALSRLLAPATHEDEPRPTLESTKATSSASS